METRSLSLLDVKRTRQMFSKLFIKLSSIGFFFILMGCVTNVQNQNDFNNVKAEKFSANKENGLDHHKNKHLEFLVVAKIKSVNDQPVEFLEFKEKRFGDVESCQVWMNDNSTLVTKSLISHVFKLKQGYFIDSVKCLKTTQFLLKPETKSYKI